jgi:hypothetical protein
MTAVIRRLEPILGLGIERLPPLVASLVVAEMFFKFHSFTLECLAFLALWRSLDWVQQRIVGGAPERHGRNG